MASCLFEGAASPRNILDRSKPCLSELLLSAKLSPTASRLDAVGIETTIDGVDDELSCEPASTEEAPVETLDSVFASLSAVELDEDVAI